MKTINMRIKRINPELLDDFSGFSIPGHLQITRSGGPVTVPIIINLLRGNAGGTEIMRLI